MADEFTVAKAQFFAGGISVNKAETKLNVVTPQYNIPESRTRSETKSSTTVDTDVADTRLTNTVVTPGTLIITANNRSRNATSPAFSFAGTEFTTQGLISGDTVSIASISSTGATTSVAGSYPISISGAVISAPSHYTDIIYREGIFTVAAEVVTPIATNTTPATLGGAAAPVPMAFQWSGGFTFGPDPVAESFKFEIDCFITGVDVYFETVDINGGDLFFQIRTMSGGFPTTTILAEKFVSPVEITAGSKAEVPHHVEFRHPTFIKGGEEYCLVVGGFSPNHRIWVARLGEPLIDNKSAIAENSPGGGVSFRSQNSSTWTVEGAETMKFSLWTAKFTSAELKLQFNAETGSELLPVDPFECEAGINKIRVFIPDHGLCSGDVIDLSMFSENVYRLSLTAPVEDARPVVGHIIYTNNANGKISSVTPITPTIYDVTITGQTGIFSNSDVFSCDSFEVDSVFGSDAFTEVIPEFSGTMSQVPIGTINGVDLSELNKEVTVALVDSIDTFLIDINSTPTQSGRFGGSGVYATPNFKYEIFNVSGEYETHGGAEAWSFTGLNHVSDGGPFINNYVEAEPKPINLKTDYHLDAPYKIASTKNENRHSVTSVTVNGVLQAASADVSPVVNIESFSMIAVSNHVGVEDQSIIDVSPNSVGRFVAETDPNLGSHAYKYVTKKITLAKPAVEVKILFDVYKDVNADFDVYIKTQAQYNTDNIDDYDWKLVPIPSKPHSVNLEDRIEYDLNCSGVVSGWPNEFIAFKVKIVGRSTNPAKPPLFKNLRIIALT